MGHLSQFLRFIRVLREKHSATLTKHPEFAPVGPFLGPTNPPHVQQEKLSENLRDSWIQGNSVDNYIRFNLYQKNR